MSIDTFLTRGELKELAGIRTKAGVIRVLRAERWPFTLGHDGWPRILRSYYDMRLNGRSTTIAQAEQDPIWTVRI